MRKLLLLCLMVLPLMAMAKESAKLEVTSPNENVKLHFWLDEQGRPTYEMTFKDRPVVLPSHLGLVLAKDKHASRGLKETDLMDGFDIANTTIDEADETWEPVWGETKTIRNHYRQLIVNLEQSSHRRVMNLIFRVFDDGIGFRYEFPQQQELNYFLIQEEMTEFAMAGDHMAWWLPGDYDTQEQMTQQTRLSEIRKTFGKAVNWGNSSVATFSPTGVQTSLQMKSDAIDIDGERRSLYINIHEAGAIEFTGHKVMEVPSENGKIIVDELEKYLETFYNDGNRDHMVFPGMVYISQPTEYGTLYSKNELEGLSKICSKYKLPLYIDGARLGYALMSKENDATIEDVAKLCDVFYIGGTKVGALCGEAVLFTKNNTPKHFITLIKQHGALLAKGRLLGIQFDTLFENNLYFEISKNAIETAEKLKEILKRKGYKFYIETPTNQQFIILENNDMNRLNEKVVFCFWEKYDENHTVVRFATSWATKMEDVEKLEEIL